MPAAVSAGVEKEQEVAKGNNESSSSRVVRLSLSMRGRRE
jgi:hypothetical protein